MQTYTEHKLTDHMLQRLSAACKPDGTYRGSNSMTALIARGLVVIDPLVCGGHLKRATPTGQEALKQARREGW